MFSTSVSIFCGKKCLQKEWANMHISLIAQTQECILDSVEINFSMNFDSYNLTNGVTKVAQI